MESSENRQKGFSFGFSKTRPSKTLVDSVIKDDDQEIKEDTDYVTSVEDKAVKTLRPVEETKQALVIPLIEKNRWRVPRPEELELADGQPEIKDDRSKPERKVAPTGDDITDQAVEELVQESRRELDNWEARGDVDQTKAIPLIMKNKVPEGYETDDRLDVQLRPDEAAEADYDNVPIEHYGMAMLRGMGFREDGGIGKHKKSVAPVQAVARPKGLGLGADRSLLLQQKADAKGAAGGADEEQLVMKRGSFCVVQAGKYDGLYATVEGIDEDNARVVIKMTLIGNVVTLNQMAVRLVTKKDYDKNSKCLNKTKVDKYKEYQEKKQRSKVSRREADGSESGSEVKHHKHKKHRHKDSDDEDHHTHTHRDSKRHKSKHTDSTRYKDSKHSDSDSRDSKRHSNNKYSDNDGKFSDRERNGRKHGDRREYAGQEQKHERHRSRSPLQEVTKYRHKDKDRSAIPHPGGSRDAMWLHPQILVRMIDPEYKKGKYYKSKVIIEDVASLDSCICRTDDGKILDGLSQTQLETVIPKHEDTLVMVVSGKYKGQVGEILHRNKSKSTASIRLADEEDLITLDYDTICEYVGNAHDL